MSIDVEALYTHLHQHPELSFQEHATAALLAGHLRDLGYAVQEGIGQTGVVGVLENGAGPVVLLRADMDGLPVLEATGLPYASTAHAIDLLGADVPVMHACGHDVHMAAMIGAAQQLVAERAEWSGTLIVLFQPAEEQGGGAQEMVDDGLYEKVPKPDIVLGQHVAPGIAGRISCHSGPAMAGTDSLHVHLYGRGGHGSQPHATVDPVVLAASTIMRLQTVVSREISPADTAVLTVGSVIAGTKENIIADEALLKISMRHFDDGVKVTMLDAVERIVRGESIAAGSPRDPLVERMENYPVTVNDPDATARTLDVFRRAWGDDAVIDEGPIAGSEDVSNLSRAVDAPLVYWFLGGTDAESYNAAVEAGTVLTDIPTNHSQYFAPVPQPTLDRGVQALVLAAREWLGA